VCCCIAGPRLRLWGPKGPHPRINEVRYARDAAAHACTLLVLPPLRLARATRRSCFVAAKKDRLEAEVALCSVKLARAEQLIGGLGGERARWTAAAAALAAAAANLVGDMVLAAAAVAYVGPFTPAFRARLMAKLVALAGALLSHPGSLPSLIGAMSHRSNMTARYTLLCVL
jgi:Microtubule-binding stalk of dynein motor